MLNAQTQTQTHTRTRTHTQQKATEFKKKQNKKTSKLPLQQFTITSKQQSQYTEALAYRNRIQYT